jgi:hypothetical protein
MQKVVNNITLGAYNYFQKEGILYLETKKIDYITHRATMHYPE